MVAQPGLDTWNITFHDKNRAADQLARIDGLYKPEAEAPNPLAELLESVPREKLRLFLAALMNLRDDRHAG